MISHEPKPSPSAATLSSPPATSSGRAGARLKAPADFQATPDLADQWRTFSAGVAGAH